MPYKNIEDKRKAQNQWMQKRRKDWFDANGPCTACGSNEKLELDHINPSIKVTHRIWTWRNERRLAELSKCQVLCKRCHKKKTKDYLSRPDNHGSYNTYIKYKCRCMPCKAFMKIHWKRRDRTRTTRESSRQTVVYRDKLRILN